MVHNDLTVLSNTDVVEKVNCLVAASQHGGKGVFQKWRCFGQFLRRDPSLWIFSKKKL